MAVTGNREPLLSWRRICYGLIGVLSLIFLYNAAHWTRTPGGSSPGPEQFPRPFRTSLLQRFTNVSADNDAIDGLTEAECHEVFPGLYAEIDRVVNYWKEQNHVISASDVEILENQAAVRILIHNNELRVLQSTHASDPLYGAPGRVLGTLHLIQRALDASIAVGEVLPTVEIALNFQDDARPPTTPGDTHTFWTVARHTSKEAHQRLWLMPNFDFWYYGSTGSFRDAKHDALQHDIPFTQKIQKLVWRGNPTFGAELRQGLVDVTQGKDWADVAPVYWNEVPSVAMKVDEFCKYAMTVYTEGVTYSGRLKFLMNCKSLLFVHDLDWSTHYSHLLVKDGPEQNYVAVQRDWSDLESKVRYYLDHPDEAEKVINNFIATFRSRYTTRAALSCYLRGVIRGYASVSFTPEVNYHLKDGSGTRQRGFSYEKFIESPTDDDFEQWE